MQLADLLGGNDGTHWRGLGLRAFLDKKSLKPGDKADEARLQACASFTCCAIASDRCMLRFC